MSVLCSKTGHCCVCVCPWPSISSVLTAKLVKIFIQSFVNYESFSIVIHRTALKFPTKYLRSKTEPKGLTCCGWDHSLVYKPQKSVTFTNADQLPFETQEILMKFEWNCDNLYVRKYLRNCHLRYVEQLRCAAKYHGMAEMLFFLASDQSRRQVMASATEGLRVKTTSIVDTVPVRFDGLFTSFTVMPCLQICCKHSGLKWNHY